MKYENKALLASVTGYAMDGFDLLLLGFLLTPIAKDLNLTGSQAGSLLTWTLIGAVAGGLVFGRLSDRLGRVKVLTWTILVFAAFTGLCAVAQGYWQLVVFRTLAGLGLGGEFGIGMTLVAESWPSKMRARASSLVAVGWQAGVLMAALLTPLLMPLIGWRGMWLVGLLPALSAFVIRYHLHEPPSFSADQSALNRTSIWSLLFANSTMTKATCALAILCTVQNFGYYAIMIWLPTYLERQLGFALTTSALWTAATVIGMICGILCFGVAADVFGRRPALLAYQAFAAVSVWGYSTLHSPLSLLIGGAVMGFFVNGMLGGYATVMAEIYPQCARATAQNVLFNFGRAAGAFGPLIVGMLSTSFSFSSILAFLSSIYIVDLVVTFLWVPETAERSYSQGTFDGNPDTRFH